MPYTLKNYDGTTLTIVDDGTIDRQFSSSLYLLGKNVTGYGVYQNDNFLWLLQNFAGSIEPINKIQGQTWFDRSEGVLKLKVYDGTNWRSLTTLDKSVSTPTASTVGDLWFKTDTSQLYVKDTTSTYALIGPPAVPNYPDTQLIADGILDTSNNIHPVLEFVVNGNIIGVISSSTFDVKSNEAVYSAGIPALVNGMTFNNKSALVATSATIANLKVTDSKFRSQYGGIFGDGLYFDNNWATSTLENNGITPVIAYVDQNDLVGYVDGIQLEAQRDLRITGPNVYINRNNNPCLTVDIRTDDLYIVSGNTTITGGNVEVDTLVTTSISAGSTTTQGTITGKWSLAPGSTLSSTYADLAENYEADDTYASGMVLDFGGSAEVTLCQGDMSTKVAGIISTNPAYVMNAHHQREGYVYSIALAGRIPCNVKGKINKGDLLVAGAGGFARAEKTPKIGSVIAKAMEDYDSTEIGQIEVMVWRG